MNTDLAKRSLTGLDVKLRTPRLVEIVGPAGAGKSTLCQALIAASNRIRLSNFPDVRRPSAAPFFLWQGARAVPSLLRRPGSSSRRLTRREFAWLSILHGWPALLQRQWERDHQLTVLDQGPVYLLTELCEFGPQYLRNQPPDRDWQALYANWAALLDAIVWLDAPDRVLARRINGREKAHLVKAKPAKTVFHFLHSFRAGYQCTISRLSAGNPGLQLLQFDTERQTPDQIAGQLVAAFGLGTTGMDVSASQLDQPKN